jgi:hypothetical protein
MARGQLDSLKNPPFISTRCQPGYPKSRCQLRIARFLPQIASPALRRRARRLCGIHRAVPCHPVPCATSTWIETCVGRRCRSSVWKRRRGLPECRRTDIWFEAGNGFFPCSGGGWPRQQTASFSRCGSGSSHLRWPHIYQYLIIPSRCAFFFTKASCRWLLGLDSSAILKIFV